MRVPHRVTCFKFQVFKFLVFGVQNRSRPLRSPRSRLPPPPPRPPPPPYPPPPPARPPPPPPPPRPPPPPPQLPQPQLSRDHPPPLRHEQLAVVVAGPPPPPPPPPPVPPMLRERVILDRERVPLERQVGIPVEPHRVVGVELLVHPVVPQKGKRALLRVGLPPLHRHPPVAETAAVRLDAPRRAVPAVDGEAMLVSPEPQDGLRHVGAQLSRRVLIAVVEGGVVLVVGEQHDPTVGQERSDDDAEPLEQPIFQRTRRLDPGELPQEGQLAQGREPLGVVSGVQADHRPILVEQAEEAGDRKSVV